MTTSAAAAPAPDGSDAARSIEARSLRLGVSASLVIAAAGLVAYGLSGSDALLLDGLYSGVMAASSLVAARIGANVVLPPDRAYPYGYDGQEALYVLFRSLLLIGMLSAAVLAAIREIGAYLGGALHPIPVELGPVGAYTVFTVALCALLAWLQHRDWVASGRCSDLLRMESQAAGLDAAITAMAGSALLAAPLLEATPMAPLVPISDALLVILLAAMVMVEPIRQFRRALGQTVGAAGDPALIPPVRTRVEALLEDADGVGASALLDLSLLKVGRTTFLVAYLDPHRSVDGRWMDGLRERVQASCGDLLGPLRTELILTSRPPFDGQKQEPASRPSPPVTQITGPQSQGERTGTAQSSQQILLDPAEGLRKQGQQQTGDLIAESQAGPLQPGGGGGLDRHPQGQQGPR